MRFSRGVALAGFVWLVSILPATCQERIKIGVISTLSGPLANSQLVAGVNAAEADFRESGRPILEFFRGDSQSKTDVTVVKAREYIERERVQALIVEAHPAVAALIPIANDARIPLFVVGNLATEIASRTGGYFFHLGSTNEDLAQLVNEFANRNAVGGDVRIFLTPEQDRTRLERTIQSSPNAKQLQFRASPQTSPSTIFVFSQGARAVAQDDIARGSLVIGGENLKADVIRSRSLIRGNTRVIAIGLRDPSLESRGTMPASLNTLIGPDGFYVYSAVQIFISAMMRNNRQLDRSVEDMRSRTFDTVIGNIKFLPSGRCLQPQLVIYELGAEKFSYCPSCTGVGDACAGGGCLCKDNSCTTDCCKK